MASGSPDEQEPHTLAPPVQCAVACAQNTLACGPKQCYQPLTLLPAVYIALYSVARHDCFGMSQMAHLVTMHLCAGIQRGANLPCRPLDTASSTLSYTTRAWHRYAMQAVWGSGTVSMVLCAIIFAVSALFVKLMDQAVPVFEVRDVAAALACSRMPACVGAVRTCTKQAFENERITLSR